MNRQLIIRGAAISVAAITASVFAAGEFLRDNETLSASAITAQPAEIRSASVVGSPTPVAPAPAPAPAELQISALDAASEKAAAPAVQDSFQPELTFADQAVPEQTGVFDARSAPVETSLCDATLSAAPAIDGLMEVRLSAPCNGSERVVISHGDLAFSTTLDEGGTFTGYIPALAADARVDVFLSDDTYLQAQTVVADFADYARMIVQWSGSAKLDLHAYHRGASYGEEGHIHALNPFDPGLEGAFLVALGDDAGLEPMLAQVYSVPFAKSADTRLQLEAVVNAQTCDQDLVAFVMPILRQGAGSVEELRVAMPDCASGDGLVILDLPFTPAQTAGQQMEFISDKS